MKILILGPELRDFNRVKNFTGVQAYYIARELRAAGVELVFAKNKVKEGQDMLEHVKAIDPQGADHVLALGLRWFTHQEKGCAAILKAKVPGAVTQMHDGLVHEHLDPWLKDVDCTFMFREDAIRTRDWNRYATKNCYIGWAADGEHLYPEQDLGVLRILIDHPYYKLPNNEVRDCTKEVTEDVMVFVKSGIWKRRWDSVRVRRLVNGGAEDVTTWDYATKRFDRAHVPFAQIAAEYRKAHVYMVTHKESVGLTCLELAYCGAITAAPIGLIYQDRLDTIRHVTYTAPVPWEWVLDQIDVQASAEKARLQNWHSVARRMLRWFQEFKGGENV